MVTAAICGAVTAVVCAALKLQTLNMAKPANKDGMKSNESGRNTGMGLDLLLFIKSDGVFEELKEAWICVGGWGQVIGQQHRIDFGQFIGTIVI